MSETAYHKIQTVYLRDPETKFRTLLDGQYALPEFEYLARNEWVFTEKIDGTNVRVVWDGENVSFGGRTDNAQMPTFLYQKLVELFDPVKVSKVLTGPIVLYGEGFGARIQKGGGNYLRDGCDFILFDAHAGVWLERDAVQGIAEGIGVRSVPEIGRGTLVDAVEAARDGFNSTFGNFQAEGLVMRPTRELLSRNGHRIISKVKCRDFG